MKKRNFHRKSTIFLLGVAFVLIAGGVWPHPAQAALITNDFYGTVISQDQYGFQTTTDINKVFTSNPNTAFVGDPFTLAVTVDTTTGAIASASFSVNNFSTVLHWPNGSFDPYWPGPFNSYQLFGFSPASLYVYFTDYNPGSQADVFPGLGTVELDNITQTLDLSQVLPAMYLSKGDFTSGEALWTDNVYNPLYNNTEQIYLQVDQVNGTPPNALPEPGILILLGFSMTGLVGLKRRWKT